MLYLHERFRTGRQADRQANEKIFHLIFIRKNKRFFFVYTKASNIVYKINIHTGSYTENR